MNFKEGVNPFGARPELVLALNVVESVYRRELGSELTVTSINDGKHSHTSLHYAGCAADLRIWGVQDVGWLAMQIRGALGNNPDYDVVVESDHIHLEYQPKYRSAPQ